MSNVNHLKGLHGFMMIYVLLSYITYIYIYIYICMNILLYIYVSCTLRLSLCSFIYRTNICPEEKLSRLNQNKLCSANNNDWRFVHLRLHMPPLWFLQPDPGSFQQVCLCDKTPLPLASILHKHSEWCWSHKEKLYNEARSALVMKKRVAKHQVRSPMRTLGRTSSTSYGNHGIWPYV